MNAHWGQIPAEWWHGGEDDGEETIVGSGVTAASRWATSERGETLKECEVRGEGGREQRCSILRECSSTSGRATGDETHRGTREL